MSRLRGLDPLRATALLFIAAGLILIVSFFYVTSQSVAAQHRLDQEWKTQVTVPQGNPSLPPASMQHPVNGMDFAISIPKLHYFAAVKEGISSTVLYDGPGHYPQTPWPGDPGTVGVAAHNVYWIDFPKLVPGDEVDLQLADGMQLKYQVTTNKLLDPDQTSEWTTVLGQQGAPDEVTVVTCDGEFNSSTHEYSERRVVQAVRVG